MQLCICFVLCPHVTPKSYILQQACDFSTNKFALYIVFTDENKLHIKLNGKKLPNTYTVSFTIEHEVEYCIESLLPISYTDTDPDAPTIVIIVDP